MVSTGCKLVETAELVIDYLLWLGDLIFDYLVDIVCINGGMDYFLLYRILPFYLSF
jgi:hypothetical protein